MVKSYFKKRPAIINFQGKKNCKYFKENGNVLLMSAILMPVIFMLAGMVIDIGRAFVYKEEISRACMIAAEEAAKEINIDAAQAYGSAILKNDYSNIINIYFYKNLKQNNICKIENLDFAVNDSISNPKYIRVISKASVKCFFLKMAGIENIIINSEGCGRLKKL
ncbi:MAG: Tad domain-containing protein [Actinobacteria bacterium]|nr:Tad domain-containing protein [Actinomycetota bacterium]